MQRVSIDDSAWQNTFPKRIAPLYDEWLGGLLLRCDEVNHWECGATVAYVFGIRIAHQVPRLIVSKSSDLQYLAQLLAIPENDLLATTFQAELMRIFDTPKPLPKYLGRSIWYKICPVCIAQHRILRRTHMLPHIECCQYHHIALLDRCRCGSYIVLFPRHALPFTCQECGLHWAKLPLIPAAPERIVLERKYLSLYKFFFAKGTPALVACAYWLHDYRWEERIGHFIFPFEGSYKARIQASWENEGPPRSSLEITIRALVREDISPQDIMSILPNALQEGGSN